MRDVFQGKHSGHQGNYTILVNYTKSVASVYLYGLVFLRCFFFLSALAARCLVLLLSSVTGAALNLWTYWLRHEGRSARFATPTFTESTDFSFEAKHFVEEFFFFNSNS